MLAETPVMLPGTVRLLVPRNTFPWRVNVPPIVSLLYNAMPAVLLTTRLLKVVGVEPPICCWTVLLNVNVLVPALNVPLLMKFPLTI